MSVDHPELPYTGETLLMAVTAAVVAFHERYHHRPPASARTEMLDDELLACVLGGVFTDVEKTLIEQQQATLVQDARATFERAMGARLIAEVERLSGRDVLLFVPNSHVGPDLDVKLFLLAPPVDDPPRAS